MTRRDRPLEPLLTAELDELAGKADTDLAREVRECPHRAAAARKILAGNDALNASLAERRPANAHALIARARSAAGAKTGRVQRDVPWPVLTGWRWVPIAAGIATLAVAAILLGVVGRGGSLPGADRDPGQITSNYPSQPLLVDAPGYNVAVIPTANPDITIFWFSKENDDVQEMDPVRDGPIGIGPGNGL